MNLDQSVWASFKTPTIKPSLTVAMLGISRHHWLACTDTDSPLLAQGKMKRHRFDVLPVESTSADGSKHVVGYYRTRTAGIFEELPKPCEQIEAADCLDYQTDFRDLLSKLTADYKNGRAPFYFLTATGESGQPEIIGLISDINLNSRAVYQYVYAVLAELEVELSTLIGVAFPQESYLEQAVRALMSGDTTHAKALKSSWERFCRDRENKRENALREYLTLGNLLHVVHKTGLHTWLGYKDRLKGPGEGRTPQKKEEFERKSGIISSLRNHVAHPVHSYRLRNDEAGRPQLFASTLQTALAAAEKMLRKLSTLRQKVDLTLDRPRVGQYFTSRAFTTLQLGEAFTPAAFCLEPGTPVPAQLPGGVTRIAYLTPQNPTPQARSWTAAETADNRELLASMQLALAQRGIQTMAAATEARPDEWHDKIKEEQKANNHYHEDGLWLLDVDLATAHEVGVDYEQDTLIYAQQGPGELVQLVACIN